MAPKAAASKAKAAPADHGSYQGKLHLNHHNIDCLSHTIFRDREHVCQLGKALDWVFDHLLTRVADMIKDAIINLKEVCFPPSIFLYSFANTSAAQWIKVRFLPRDSTYISTRLPQQNTDFRIAAAPSRSMSRPTTRASQRVPCSIHYSTAPWRLALRRASSLNQRVRVYFTSLSANTI